MIKLIVGIVLLILILLSANYIFVEQFTCDSNTIRPFIESPNDDSFENVKDCCQDIFSGANSLNKKLYEMEDGTDKLNYDNSHALLLTFCNKNKNQSPVHPLQKQCSEYGDDSLDRCLANDNCQIKDVNIDKCKNICGGRYLEEGDTYDTNICKTEQVYQEKQYCMNSRDPVSCENNSIVIDGKQINHCFWDSENDLCENKSGICGRLYDEVQCNEDELCYYDYQSGSCEYKSCSLPEDGAQEESRLPESACETKIQVVDKDLNSYDEDMKCQAYQTENDCENDFCTWHQNDFSSGYCDFNADTYCENKSNEADCDLKTGCEFISATHPICTERV